MKKSIFLLIGGSLLFLLACTSKNKDVSKEQSPNKTYMWKMTTAFPPDFPIIGESATYYAKLVEELSAGRIKIKVYGAGELVPAMEAFEAVSNGTIELAYSASYYWTGKIPEAQFFTTVPFGMSISQTLSWIMNGGGYELWKEIYAKYNLVPFLAGNTGYQFGGFFNKEINSLEDLKGLKIRMPGLGGKILSQVGATPILLPGGELYTSLERGVIDAVEWVGPEQDYAMGLHKISKYYYYPGWQEPGANLDVMIYKKIYDELPKDLQTILYTAGIATLEWSLTQAKSRNAVSLEKMLKESNIQLKVFPKELLEKLRVVTNETIKKMGEENPEIAKVIKSYFEYKKKTDKALDITDQAYFDMLRKTDVEK